MTDDLFDEDGTFDDGFFSSLAANPDDPASAYEPAFGPEAGEDDYRFLYETEADGSFETDGEDFADDDLDYEPVFDDGLGTDTEIDLEPDFDPDGDFHHEGDDEFGPEFGRGF
ncbi:hypothetical protein [Glycomyces tritici]|uniref:Uncharacterized protein n=1 Tax=Glycomyces tritici TaxID=2665176 RepID=A0ABT7YK39_9ACTN|nr:hypothetical protein [Glycomyces tritici]MDN3238819.1 hypothetical protein [Glycomyces tritici]